MGHRQLFSTAQMLEDEYQNLNHIHGRGRVPDNYALAFPIENGVNTPSNWSSVLRPNEYSSSHVCMELPHYRIVTPSQSYNPFLQPSDSMSFYPAHNYAIHPSSSSHYQHVIHQVEGGYVSTNNGSRASKRTRPAYPMRHERGSTSSHNSSAGGSLDFSIWSMEKPASGLLHWPWEVARTTTRYREGTLSVTEGDLQRNVRSRPTLNLDVNRAITSNPFRQPYPVGDVTDHSSTVSLSSGSVGISQLWSHHSVTSAPQQSILAAEASQSIRGTNQFHARNSANISLDVDPYRFDLTLGSSAVTPSLNLHNLSVQAVRGARRGHSQRAVPVRRVTSSYQNTRHLMDSPNTSLQPVREIYHSRYSRSHSTLVQLNSERFRQSMVPYDRFRPISVEVDSHHRQLTGGAYLSNHRALHGSRSSPDQHGDMMLDTDNMTYEELLALGERIGNVSTGLSEDLILKCLVETVHHPSLDQTECETCVICLDEYIKKDVIGTFVNCRHSYHMSCIKKWLSMKNVCPICKASALSDSSKK